MLTSSDRAVVQPILNSIGAYVYLVDVLEEGTFRYFAVNWPEDEDLGLGYTGSIIGKTPEEVFKDERAERLPRFYEKCIGQRSHLEFEGFFVSASGSPRWASHFLAPIFDLNGRIVRIMGTVVDITQRKQAEQALRESKALYHTLYDDNPAKLMTLDLEGVIVSVNKFGAQYSGFTREEMVNTSIFDYIHKDDRDKARLYLQRIAKAPEQVHRSEFRGVHKDGTITWVSNIARVTLDSDGKEVILIVAEDITEAHELAGELFYQASHDSLTGLVNRREFEHRLQQVLETAQSGKSPHALCYLDLDQFKIINDTCGHIAGDELLRQLGNLLADKIRDHDTLARLGGDEFAVIMKDCALDEAGEMSAVLCRVIEEYEFVWKDKRFHIGVSIGIVPITAASGGMTNILSAAERACYAAKEKGQNRIHMCREDDKELETRRGEMEWVNRIKTAINENRLRLFFQPISPVRPKCDGEEHYELLLRMEDEEGSMISAGEFLPAAEQYNLATKLDQWVVRTAFAWLAEHPLHVEKLSFGTINLSGSTLADDAFIDFVIDEFAAAGIPPQKICFEITETAAITNMTSAMHFISTLKERGFLFALDDFGSGWSSLAYLKKFPVDYLKIDGIFVKDIDDDPVDLALVKSINEIGHLMGKKTIAEFVESHAIHDKLREIGVDYCQGYGIGRPQPIAVKK